MNEQTRGPSEHTVAYKIAACLKRNGPMTLAEVFAKVDFYDNRASRKRLVIDRRIESGWFQMEGDKLALTEFAATYMVGRVDMTAAEPTPKFIGSMATGPQFNMLTRPPYKSPRRVVRADVPAWSVRPDGFGFKALSGACGVVA